MFANMRRESKKMLFDMSLNKHEKKKSGAWSLLSFCVLVLTFCVVFSSYIGLLSPPMNWNLERGANFKAFPFMRTSYEDGESINNQSPAICNFSTPKSDFCEIKGEVRVHGISSTVFIDSILPEDVKAKNQLTWRLKPYARKTDARAMSKVKEFSLGASSSFGRDTPPECTVNHNVSGVLFSTGGYIGNHYHEITDILIPLYITSRPLNREVQFVVTGYRSWWSKKFGLALNALTKYSIIDLDKDPEIHCFPSLIVGLKAHRDFEINPSLPPYGYSMKTFTRFLRVVYSLQRSNVTSWRENGGARKPRLLILSRKNTRALLNEEEVAAEARELGFEVVTSGASFFLKMLS